MTTALEAVDLAKQYGDIPALRDVSMTVDGGEEVALIGSNGSGKTTLLRIFAGLLEATDGKVSVTGRPPASIEARRAASFVPDAPVLYDDLSVREHLEYVARLHGRAEWAPRADMLLERLGLATRQDDLPARFSRGLRQRTALALALVRPFKVLLVDEPFVGLDPDGRRALVDLLAEAADEGAAVVVATHQPDYTRQARRVVGLRDGTVAYDGPITDEIVDDLTA